jgi:hypothetical protein
MKQFLVAGFLMLATGAQALDCVSVDVATRFNSAQASAVSFVILLGRFEFDASLMPGDGVPDDFVEPLIPAQFIGKTLTPDGFTADLVSPVDVQLVCAGAWCGQMAAFSENTVAFAQVIDGRYVIEVEPCGSWVFGADDAVIATLTACMRGDPCVELAE